MNGESRVLQLWVQHAKIKGVRSGFLAAKFPTPGTLKHTHWDTSDLQWPKGLKPETVVRCLAARLKPCPFTNSYF